MGAAENVERLLEIAVIRQCATITGEQSLVAGVIENMSYLNCPHCGERTDVFGKGGGDAVADALTRVVGAPVPVLGQVPIDVRVREAGDTGQPIVLAHPDSPAAVEFRQIAEKLAGRSRSLSGRSLGLTPV